MQFDFVNSGSGPALLFLPGSYSTKDAWKGVHAALQGSYRIISTSLPGYGGTSETRADTVSDMSLMLDFVEQVIDEVGEPVHLIGHSFGGLVTLAKALTKAPPPLSIITFEGNPVYSRPDQGRFDWKDHLLDVGQQFEQAYASGDPDAAALIIDYWGGHGFFQSMPDKVRDFCRSTAYTNILDWRAASGFTPKMSEFSSLNIPASLVRGELANAAIVEITGLLEQAIPDAKMHVVDGAGHFLISTHPQQCAAIIDQHMHHFFGGQQR